MLYIFVNMMCYIFVEVFIVPLISSVLVKGATLWNVLDIDFKNISKRKNFRAQFKTDKVNSYDRTQ